MNCVAIGTAMKRCGLERKRRRWHLPIFIAMLLTWTLPALAQQRDSIPSEELGAVSSTQKADEPSSDSAATQADSADRMIAILRENSEALSTVKNEIAQRVSVDPATINDEVVYARIRKDADLRERIAQELKARGYDIGGDALLGSRPRSERRSQAVLRRKQEIGEEDESGAELQQRPSPYPQLPSLKDLYSQLSASQGKLKRFGSAVFSTGTGNSSELPMDLPMGPDYVLGPGDALVLNLWGSTSQRLNRTIDRQGEIALPEAGAVSIAGVYHRARSRIDSAGAEQPIQEYPG